MMKEDFFIVGIGASAGGLQALKDFFPNVKGNPGVAFVVVQHLKSDIESQLASILSNFTHLEVIKINGRVKVIPNKIYVMPEGKKLDIIDGYLSLIDRPADEKINNAINHFLFSLAKDMKERAIGVILSGTGTDGTDGCFAIEKNGGVTIVQDPSSAQFDGMPLNSIRYDHPDYILTPQSMPALIELIASGKEDKNKRRKSSLLDFYGS